MENKTLTAGGGVSNNEKRNRRGVNNHLNNSPYDVNNVSNENSEDNLSEILAIGHKAGYEEGHKAGYEEGYEDAKKEAIKKYQEIIKNNNTILEIITCNLIPELKKKIEKGNTTVKFKDVNTVIFKTDYFHYTITVNYNDGLLNFNLEHSVNLDTSSSIIIIFITIDDLIEELLNLYEVYSSNLDQ